MTRKSAKPAERSGPRSRREALQILPFGFRLPEQNAIVRPGSWSSGQCRTKIIRELPDEEQDMIAHQLMWLIEL